MIKTSGNEKTHYTVVLACCADGTKFPPLLIFKRKSLPKDVIPHGNYLHVHSKGWMDGKGMKLWLEKVWYKHPGGLLKKIIFISVRSVQGTCIKINTKACH